MLKITRSPGTRQTFQIFLFTILAFGLGACASIPPNVEPITGFEIDKYMGKWYEIIRIDNRFEKGMDQVTANYTLQENGTVKVVNRGYLVKEQQWEEAIGKAKFGANAETGYLQVSFFGPFYGPYVIYELDEQNYQYAFVTSGDGYLWLLARTPTVSDDLIEKFIRSAEALGYSKQELLFVNQN